jgi:hypothetical protein
VVNAMPWMLYTQEKAPVPIVQEDVWAPGTVWINVEKRKSLAPTRVQTPNHPACSKSLYYVMWPLIQLYRGADKSLARPTSRCILFGGENILFDASLVIYIYNVYSTNNPPIMVLNTIYEHQNLLSL